MAWKIKLLLYCWNVSSMNWFFLILFSVIADITHKIELSRKLKSNSDECPTSARPMSDQHLTNPDQCLTNTQTAPYQHLQCQPTPDQFIWPTPNPCLTSTTDQSQPTPDFCTTNIQPRHNQCLTNAMTNQHPNNAWSKADQSWLTPDQCPTNAWPMLENHWPMPPLMPDQSPTNPQPTHYQHLNNAWPTPNQHPTLMNTVNND